MNEGLEPPERTLENIIRLLSTCVPRTKRENKTAFEIIIEGCKIKSIQDKYEYFKHTTFGIHSNCYRETVQLCVEALQELSLNALEEAIKKAKEARAKEPSKSCEDEAPLFDKLTKVSGQFLQVAHYQQYLTALHEAGHAVAHYLLGMPFSGVTIVQTDKTWGKLFSASAHSQCEVYKEAIALYAGGLGEAAVLNLKYPSILGQRNDIYTATKIIKQEVINELSNPRDAFQYVFIAADALGLTDKESPYIIYETIKRCVAIRQQAIDLITAHKDMVADLADELLKRQSMPSEEVIAFLDVWRTQHNHQ